MLDDLLSRSAVLESRLLPVLEHPPLYPSDRITAVRGMVGITFEHSQSLKILAAARNCTSSIGMLRLQYEALTRGFWLLYVAPDSTIEKLMNGFSREQAGESEKMAMLAKMLEALEGRAPEPVLISLQGFQANHWKPLNSFVHGGIHALHRHRKGYPVDLVLNIIRASNALSLMAANLANLVTSEPFPPGALLELQFEFATCLPPLGQSAI
ncbi:MAG: hypothetical protein F9K25_12840 [Candidatus Contendobacter sp.]|nr:MAG: hypothetical protein F9K25_12840 [Candidatus Contendobacter sp.]